jgi:hypothetical protein
MIHRIRAGIIVLVSAAFLFASWGTASLAVAAPICAGCADDMSDMPGMDHPTPGKVKTDTECMVKLGCYATCAKLPARDTASSVPAFTRLAFVLSALDKFDTVSSSPELSPPKV